jgi:hypothetical protein
MAGRLTWRVPQWRAAGRLVEFTPELQARWGVAIAVLVGVYRAIAVEAADRPSSADVRRTLAAIARDPAGTPWHDLDPETISRMDEQAWRQAGELFAESLSRDGQQLCATAALAAMTSRKGRRRTHALAVQFVSELLPLLPAKERRGAGKYSAVAELLLAAQLVAQLRPSSRDSDITDTVRIVLFQAGRRSRAVRG